MDRQKQLLKQIENLNGKTVTCKNTKPFGTWKGTIHKVSKEEWKDPFFDQNRKHGYHWCGVVAKDTDGKYICFIQGEFIGHLHDGRFEGIEVKWDE